MQRCQVTQVEGRGWGGEGKGRGRENISPDLLDRLPATVEEERGR